MSGGERGDGPDQLALEPDQEEQAQHEQQMVVAGEDVLDTECGVGTSDLQAAALVLHAAIEIHARLRGGKRVDV